jgi:MFS family permease
MKPIHSNKNALAVILAASSLTVMAGAIISPIIRSMEGVLSGANESNVRFIITTHSLFIAICSPIIGSLIDRIGVKKPFIVGLTMYGLAGGSGLFISQFWIMIVSRAILGIAVAAIMTPIAVIILNLYSGDERNKIMGWQASMSSFGGFVWPLLGGILALNSWNLPFGIYLLGVPIGFLAWITIPEIQHRPKAVQPSAPVKEKTLSKIFRNNPIIFVIYAFGLLTMMLLYTYVTFIPQLLGKSFGITNTFIISSYLGAMGFAAAVSSLLYRRIKAKLPYKMIVLVALALWAVGFLLLSQIITEVAMIVSIVLYGIGQGIVMPMLILWIGDRIDLSFRGRIISYLTTFYFVGQFLPPVIFNPIFSAFDFNGVFLVAGIGCAISCVLFSYGMKKRARLAR